VRDSATVYKRLHMAMVRENIGIADADVSTLGQDVPKERFPWAAFSPQCRMLSSSDCIKAAPVYLVRGKGQSSLMAHRPE
jgi:hypothetical protein